MDATTVTWGRIGEGTGVLVGEYNIAIAHSSIVEFFQSNTMHSSVYTLFLRL